MIARQRKGRTLRAKNGEGRGSKRVSPPGTVTKRKREECEGEEARFLLNAATEAEECNREQEEGRFFLLASRESIKPDVLILFALRSLNYLTLVMHPHFVSSISPSSTYQFKPPDTTQIYFARLTISEGTKILIQGTIIS